MGSETITRIVRVPSGRSGEEMLDATRRQKSVGAESVKSMPRGAGDLTEVIFYRPKRWIKDDEDLDKELAEHNLVPADPYSQAQANIDDPAFADEHPNFSHWQDHNGKWHFAKYRLWNDERSVEVYHRTGEIGRGWWIACVRKSTVA